MDRNEERELERKVKEEHKAHGDAKDLYAGIANGIPNDKDDGGHQDALNATLASGKMGGSHETNINTQTDLELGGLADPGGVDPVMDQQFLENMKKNIRKHD